MLSQSTTLTKPEPAGNYWEPVIREWAKKDPFAPVFHFIGIPRRRRPVKQHRAALLERDGHNCGLCRTPLDLAPVHIDHILPLSWQGSNAIHNLQLTHGRCNLLKQLTLDTSLRGGLETATLKLWNRHAGQGQPGLRYADLARTARAHFQHLSVRSYPPDVGWIVSSTMEMQVGVFKPGPRKHYSVRGELGQIAASPEAFMVAYYSLEAELAGYVRLLF